MKLVTVTVDDSKYKFFLELMKSMGFVLVSDKRVFSRGKEELIHHIVEGMVQAKQASKGKLRSKPAQKFLDEL